MPLFLPADTFSALFNSYPDAAKAIFRVDLIDEFWDSVRDDDPKLKALIQEVDWVPWLSGGLGIFIMQWLGKLVHC